MTKLLSSTAPITPLSLSSPLAPSSPLSALMPQSAVALRLGVSERTLERKRCDGTGPRFIRVGRAVRYTERDLVEWLESQTVRSTSEKGAL
jgi:predicted DNA-binding transcriptional regulator AlpA